MKNKKSIVLIICIAVISIIAIMLFTRSYAIPDEETQADLNEVFQKNKITMTSDYTTVDSYKEYFEEDNTKNIGKVWTDKSVYDYQKNKGNITLDSNFASLNGGKGFNINYNNEFLHVFSALGSSQTIDTQNVLDFLIVIDMSGSMGVDVVDELEHEDEETRIAHSRIQATINSVNKTIDTLMNQNKENRVAVVVYGTTAYTLMELGHYQKVDNATNYITVENFMSYSELTFPVKNSAAYTLRLKAIKDGKVVERNVRNNYTDGKTEEQLQKSDNWIGFHTNLQAGIYLGFNELYSNVDTKIVRKPVAVIMTDGGSNFGLKRDDENNNVGDEWYDVPLIQSASGYSNVNYKMYRAEDHKEAGKGGKEVMLEILLTASYMKSKVLHKYEEVVKKIEGFEGQIEFDIHTVSVDTPETNWQVPRVYTTLDPTNYFKKELPNVDWEFKSDSTDAYKLFEEWVASKDGITSKFQDSDSYDENNVLTDRVVELKINKLPGTKDGVTNEDVIANINYNDTFEDIKAAKLEDYFANIINTAIEVFKPISDTESSLFYQDAIGEYLEVKEVKELLLYGVEYNIVLGNKDGNKQYYKAVGSNGEDLTLQNKNYLKPLTFKLSDIVIWTETTNNGIETFNVEIPSEVLPLRVNKILLDSNKEVLDYTTKTDTVDNLPIRVLYTVGLKSELIDKNNKVDFSKLSDEYKTKNTIVIDGHEYVTFNSNYYNSNNSYGDAKTTMVPSENNVYYYYQENLPIYETSSGGDKNGEGELKATGGKVTLSDNVKSLDDIDKDKTYYYAVEYYVKTENGPKRCEYAVQVKGSDLYDENGNLKLTYYDTKTKKEVTTPGSNTVVATKKGSKKIDDFEGLSEKQENVTNTSKYTMALEDEDRYLEYYLGNNGNLLVSNVKNIEIRKEVRGTSGDKNKDWKFTIKLTPKTGITLDGSYAYIGGSFVSDVSKPSDGDLMFTKQSDGSYLGTFTIRHGQSITLEGIPVGTSYQITEQDANTDDYKLVATNNAGIIEKDNLAYFENTKGFALPKTGELGPMLPTVIGTIFIGFGVFTFLYIKSRKKKKININY